LQNSADIGQNLLERRGKGITIPPKDARLRVFVRIYLAGQNTDIQVHLDQTRLSV